jgi:hypothetical protein
MFISTTFRLVIARQRIRRFTVEGGTAVLAPAYLHVKGGVKVTH